MTTYAGLYGPEALIDGTGHPITSATIDVFTHGTTTHVSLYKDNARVTPLSNPVPNGVDGSTAGGGLDTFGNLSFYVDPGRYDLRIATGAGTRTVEIEIETDPAESAASGPSGGAAWVTGTSYTPAAIVTQSGVNYECAVAHTAGTFATDLAAGKWIETGVNSAGAATLSNTAAVDLAAAAASGTATSASRQDHVHRSLGLLSFFWGDGSDGTAVMDGTNTFAAFATKSGSVYTLIRDVHLTSLTVNSGVTLVGAGYRIQTRSLTNNGTIHNNGTNAAGATAGAGGARGTLENGTGGAAGGTGNGANAAATFGWTPGNSPTSHGGSGGTSGANTAGSGGSIQVQYAGMVGFFNTCFTGVLVNSNHSSYYGTTFTGGGGGGAGAGDATNAGGGGGGAGGALIVNARVLAGNGVISCNGGNGGNGAAGNAAGGGGGGGGTCIVNTTDTSGWTGTVTAALGTGGTSQGTGGVPPTSPFSGGPSAGTAQLTVWQ